MSRFARYMATVFANVLSFANILTNGRFSSGTTGWTFTGSELTVADGQGVFAPLAVNREVRQDKNLTAGNYYFKMTYKKPSGALSLHVRANVSPYTYFLNYAFPNAADMTARSVLVTVSTDCDCLIRLIATDVANLPTVTFDDVILVKAPDGKDLAWCDANISPFIIY